MKTLTPWSDLQSRLEELTDVGFDEITVDGSSYSPEVHLNVLGLGNAIDLASPWEDLQIHLRVEIRQDSNVVVPHDARAVVVLRCEKTELRRGTWLDAVEPPSQRSHAWAGAVSISRADVYGSLSPIVQVIGTQGTVPGAKLIERTYSLVIDPLEFEVSPQGDIEVRWRNFEDEAVDPPELRNSAGATHALLFRPDGPVLFLNEGLGDFKRLAKRQHLMAPVSAGRSLLFLAIAYDTRLRLLRDVLGGVYLEEGDPTGVQGTWAHKLLQQVATRVDDLTLEDLEARAVDVYRRDREEPAADQKERLEFDQLLATAVSKTVHVQSKVESATRRLTDAH